MGIFSNASGKTQPFSSILLVSGALILSAFAGSDGTRESELSQREAAVAEAKNKLNAELLKGKKADAAVIKAREDELNTKQTELNNFFQSGLVRSSKDSAPAKAGDYAPKPSAPREPETVLSGEGIQNEITYQKKSGKKALTVAPTPAPSAVENSGGVSEIQYSKKSGKKKAPEPSNDE